MNPETTLWTVARIASHLGVDRHRIEYLIDAREIKPIARAGIARIFAPSDVDRLAREIEKIDAEREGGAL
jgi:predicted transcriptional regulator